MSSDKTRPPGIGDQTIADVPGHPALNPATAPYSDPDSGMPKTATDLKPDGTLDPDNLESQIMKRMQASSARVRLDPFIGQTIAGKYEVVGKIGSGGMGVVYKARQKGMDRNVAIKVLLKEYLSNDQAVKRFQREALAVSRLEHPNTIRIYDFGEVEAGTLYIAMEFLAGKPLAGLLRDNRQLPVRRVLRIIQQMARSLDEAHRKGIIHRDLKPDNVFVGDIDSNADYVKVLDFGVAKLLEGQDDRGTLTQHGVIFGTPKYMSPEQCRSQEVDARSDIYALGVMMYEMLSGNVPFESDNPLAILIMHSQDPPSAMSEVRPDLVIPFEVEALLHKLLAKEPKARVQSSKELAEACDDLLARVPDEFEKILTYDDAEKSGLGINRAQAYTVPERPISNTIRARLRGPDEMDRETMAIHAPRLPMSKKKKGVIAAAAFLLVLASGMAAVAAQLDGVPPEARAVIPSATTWATGPLPALTPDLITVTLRTNLGNVTILDKATGAVLGAIAKADQPVPLEFLREPGRKVTIALRHGDELKSVDVDLGQSQAPGTVIFAPPVVAEVPMVKLTVASSPGALLQIEGQDVVHLVDDAGAPKIITLPKSDAPLTVTATKPGFLPAKAPFTPGADGRLELVLTPDPAAAEVPAVQEVTVTLNLNVGKVRVKVKSSGQMFETPEKTDETFKLKLPRSDQPETLLFERAGWKSSEQLVTPTADATLAVILERKKAADPGISNTDRSKEPTIPKVDPIKKPDPDIKLGPIKSF